MPEFTQYSLEGGTSPNNPFIIKIKPDSNEMATTKNDTKEEDTDDVNEEIIDDNGNVTIKIEYYAARGVWGFIYFEKSVQRKGYKSKEDAVDASLKFVISHLAKEKEQLLERIVKIEGLLAKLD